MFKNWKTTLAGIASICTGVVAITNGDIYSGATAIIAGLGLVVGKDFNVTGTP